MWDPYAEFETTVLPNGLTVYAAHWPNRPWESVGFIIHTGAKDDPVDLEGLAHFTEHLVSKNTSSTRQDIYSLFEDCGGGVSLGMTGFLHTEYKFFLPINQDIISRALLIFGDMLFSAKINNGIEKERKIILEEFNRDHSLQLMFNLSLRRRKEVFSGSWLERMVDVLGTPDSINRISQKELQALYDAHYSPGNMSIVGVGGLKLQELVDLISNSPFKTDKAGERNPLPQSVSPLAAPKENRYVLEWSQHFSSPAQVGTYSSAAAIPGLINNTTIKILCLMLNEVLMEEIRESRNWTYRIDSSYITFKQFHDFGISCSSFSLSALESIENVVDQCISSLKGKEDLLEQIKQRELASLAMVDLNGSGLRDGAIDDLRFYHRIFLFKEFAASVRNITMSDIEEALNWLSPERRWTLLTKP